MSAVLRWGQVFFLGLLFSLPGCERPPKRFALCGFMARVGSPTGPPRWAMDSVR